MLIPTYTVGNSSREEDTDVNKSGIVLGICIQACCMCKTFCTFLSDMFSISELNRCAA